jgi:hypothetical protein
MPETNKERTQRLSLRSKHQVDAACSPLEHEQKPNQLRKIAHGEHERACRHEAEGSTIRVVQGVRTCNQWRHESSAVQTPMAAGATQRRVPNARTVNRRLRIDEIGKQRRNAEQHHDEIGDVQLAVPEALQRRETHGDHACIIREHWRAVTTRQQSRCLHRARPDSGRRSQWPSESSRSCRRSRTTCNQQASIQS